MPVAAKVSAQAQPNAKSLTCSQCGQSFKAPHNLAQHIQYRHQVTPRVDTKRSAEVRTEASPIVSAAVSNPHAHLEAALQELTQRQRAVEEQLSRMAGLQAEKDAIMKQVEALSVAISAFQL